MLTGQAATHLNTEPQDIRAHRFTELKIALFVGVKHDQRVHIAIARMEHIANAQTIVIRELFDPAQHFWQGRHRNGSIQTHIVRHLTHSAKSGFAAQPNRSTFSGRLALTQFNRIVFLRNHTDATQLILDFCL